jgi:hypothetical protein
MKNRLTITINESLLQQARKYAYKHNTSVSRLVEDYFTGLTKQKNILDVIRSLPKPAVEKPGDIKHKDYYEQRQKKYRF